MFTQPSSTLLQFSVLVDEFFFLVGGIINNSINRFKCSPFLGFSQIVVMVAFLVERGILRNIICH